MKPKKKDCGKGDVGRNFDSSLESKIGVEKRGIHIFNE